MYCTLPYTVLGTLAITSRHFPGRRPRSTDFPDAAPSEAKPLDQSSEFPTPADPDMTANPSFETNLGDIAAGIARARDEALTGGR